MYQKKANTRVLANEARTSSACADFLRGRVAGDAAPVTRIENGIPPFAESELARLYGSFYASLPQLEIEGSAAGVHSYIASRGDEIGELWLFRVEKNEARVLNEAIPVQAEAVRRFADTIFPAWPGADMIVFNAVYPELGGLGLPYQRFHCSDDCVLTLPAGSDAYLAMLGKATRKNLKRYLSRLIAAFPTFRYEVYEGEAAPERLVRAIVALNRRRMAAKGKLSGIDASEEARILRLVKRCGWIGVATIDGAVCAGAIVYRAGDNFFSFVRAHDPAYDDYRLGLIGAYHLVCACIARGGRELHFMWGREPHKALLGGEQRELERVVVFRSRMHALRHADLVLKNAAGAFMRAAKLRLFEQARHEDSAGGRLLARALGAARRLKRGIRRGNGEG